MWFFTLLQATTWLQVTTNCDHGSSTKHRTTTSGISCTIPDSTETLPPIPIEARPLRHHSISWMQFRTYSLSLRVMAAKSQCNVRLISNSVMDQREHWFLLNRSTNRAIGCRTLTNRDSSCLRTKGWATCLRPRFRRFCCWFPIRIISTLDVILQSHCGMPWI